MSARVRRPTNEASAEAINEASDDASDDASNDASNEASNEVATEIYDPARQRARRQPPPAAAPLTPLFESFEQDVTEVTPIPSRAAIELAAPAAPVERRRGLERSEPIRVISMKEQAEAARQRNDEARVPLHVQLRSMAEVAGRNDTPVKLGRLAPPRDPREARARHVRANVIWACVAVVLACAISLAIWLVAGR